MREKDLPHSIETIMQCFGLQSIQKDLKSDQAKTIITFCLGNSRCRQQRRSQSQLRIVQSAWSGRRRERKRTFLLRRGCPSRSPKVLSINLSNQAMWSKKSPDAYGNAFDLSFRSESMNEREPRTAHIERSTYSYTYHLHSRGILILIDQEALDRHLTKPRKTLNSISFSSGVNPAQNRNLSQKAKNRVDIFEVLPCGLMVEQATQFQRLVVLMQVRLLPRKSGMEADSIQVPKRAASLSAIDPK